MNATRAVLWCLTVAATASAATNQYLFIGHPRADGPGQIVQREVERVDFAAYDLLLLGGDYAPSGTGSRDTVDYLDAVFDLGAPSVLAALGNHDTSHKNYFTDVTGRPTHYTFQTNGVVFVVLDTTDDGHDILGDELQMLRDVVNGLTSQTHLVLIHHHIIWLADYAPLAYLFGDERLGASSTTLSGLNFQEDVYPLLLRAVSNGVEVVCVAGDRTGSDLESSYGAFHIEHETAEGVHFLAAGLKEDLPAPLRTAIVFDHDAATGALGWSFLPLSDLPRVPDEPVVITELHYDPSPAQGNSAFIELLNRGGQPYDLSMAWFSRGIDFVFPSNTVIAPGERVLVAADPAVHADLGVRVFDYDGESPPAAGEPIWLRDRRGMEIDHVLYDSTAPWPFEPNNLGPSLALIRPDLDNDLPENWAASDHDGGSPGAENFAPTICSNISVSANLVAMNWAGAVNGGRYRLEWTPAHAPLDWRLAADEAVAATETLSLSVTNSAAAGLYRLQRVFPVIAPPSYTNLIASGAIWKYRDTGDDPGSEWMSPAYDDGDWAAGPSKLGYGDGDEATELGYGPNAEAKYATTHFRHHFHVEDPALLGAIRCDAKIDDGAIFYLNGTEVARLRVQTGAVTYQDYTTTGGRDYDFEAVDFSANEFIAGDNVLAVEVHQSSGTSSDVSMDLNLMAVELSP